MNVLSKGGVEVCIPYGVATWHWCDMTFIDPLVVKLDYGKVSASDLSGLKIALWYFGAARDDLRYRPVGLSESTWISILL